MGWKKPLKANCTVTLKLRVALLPEESTASATTVVVPIGKRDPEAGVVFTDALPQVSAAEGEKVTGMLVELAPSGNVTTMSEGTVIVDGSVSALTLTEVLQLVIPKPSLTSIVRRCVPSKSSTEVNVTRRLSADVGADVVPRTVAPSFNVSERVWLKSGSVTLAWSVTEVGAQSSVAASGQIIWGGDI